MAAAPTSPSALTRLGTPTTSTAPTTAIAAARRSRAGYGLSHESGNLNRASSGLGCFYRDTDIYFLLLKDILPHSAADLTALHLTRRRVCCRRAARIARIRGTGRNTLGNGNLNDFFDSLHDALANIDLLLLHGHSADFDRICLLFGLVVDFGYRACCRSGSGSRGATGVAIAARHARVTVLLERKRSSVGRRRK